MKEIQDGDVTFTKQIPTKTKLLECPDQGAAEFVINQCYKTEYSKRNINTDCDITNLRKLYLANIFIHFNMFDYW